MLDTEMSSIRKEILDAQRDFEEKSNMVSSVLSGIQELYFFHRVREAVQFQLRFNELWEQEDAWGIRTLADDIRVALQKAKKSGHS